MLKCPGCGAIAKDTTDTCGVCGTSLLQARSEELEDIVKETGKPQDETDPHWKRRALLPPLVFLGLSIGLILSGFFLLLYSQPPFRGFTSFMAGLIFLWVGFVVLLYMVIGAGPSERYGGWWPRRRSCDSEPPHTPANVKAA